MRFRIDVWEGGRIARFSLKANRLRTVLTTVGFGVREAGPGGGHAHRGAPRAW